MKKKKIILDAYEREIEKNLHKAKPVANQEEERANLIQAAKNYMAERQSVTIRMQRGDIFAMKKKAEKMGMPYQTYINMVIHRHAISSKV